MKPRQIALLGRNVSLFGFVDSPDGPVDINPLAFEKIRRLNLEALDLAKRQAKLSRCHRKHRGAVIVDRNGNIISFGRNGENHGNAFFRLFYSERFPGRSLHAEYAALAKIPRQDVSEILRLKPVISSLHGARIYSYRVVDGGFCATSRPCHEMCWPTLQKLGFRDAVYLFRALEDTSSTFIAHEMF